MALTIAEREHRAIAQILSEFHCSDTDDVPLSAIVRSALVSLGSRAEAAEQDWQAAEQETLALKQQLTAALRERDEADARILALESAITAVVTRYGDDGWARSEMCRLLRSALDEAPRVDRIKALTMRAEAAERTGAALRDENRELRLRNQDLQEELLARGDTPGSL